MKPISPVAFRPRPRGAAPALRLVEGAARDLDPESELARFLGGTLDPAGFDHAAHVRMARAVLAGHDFLEAAWIYDRSLRRLTAAAGDDTKRSLTKTLAFLAILAESGESPPRDALERWYSPERLADPAGRDLFLMPDR